MKTKLAQFTSLMLPLALLGAEPARITVNVDRPGHRIPPTLWGIFFEDIQLSADGGIYAELVRNRSFEDMKPVMNGVARNDIPDYWTLVSSGPAKVDLSIDARKPLSAKNPHSLRVAIAATGKGRVGVANNGYYGMGISNGESYRLSLNARADGNFSGPLTVSLESADGQVYAREQFSGITSDWKKFTATLTASDTDPNARLVISTDKPCTFWLDMVSLMPAKTWRDRGLRPDLAEMLAGLKPAFCRFPGGCWVEGASMKDAYRWKDTIGDPSERRTQNSLWGYQATHGIGFHEYLVMCEDFGCEPLFVINVGMAHGDLVPMDQMGEFVQDALDAIEYANGPVESKWGALRAKAGHPAPFNLKTMEIGNENGGRAYAERWPLFVKAIKGRYPEMHLIANHWVGTYPTDPMPEIVDEHFYSDPEYFMRNATRFDTYDRKGPKVYAGEYAVTRNVGPGNLRGAVGEAAFMTGMERNSDVVVMASYAPLLCNVNHKVWPTNLINFDSHRAFGIPSYYVQQMFVRNTGNVLLPTTVDVPLLNDEPIKGRIGVGTWNTQAEFKEIKVIRNGETLAVPELNDTKGLKLLGRGKWKAEGGVLTQSASIKEDARAVFGDGAWSDYTLSLKARKLGGTEGFLISFGLPDDGVRPTWVLGGLGNKGHYLRMDRIDDTRAAGKIEIGRWYDIRVELKGQNLKCYLDGRLVHEVNSAGFKPLFASASRDDKTGEIILKVVNADTEARETEINLSGISGIAGPAKGIVLTSANATDENTFDEPDKVAPKEITIEKAAPKFNHTFPANSVTVLRLKNH